ncbi:flagellar assembly protein FliH [Sporolactobacillus sp. THM7-7]|nr:flagellar assembly protein FliH [Sporolactobacillus sp. THM7-7]
MMSLSNLIKSPRPSYKKQLIHLSDVIDPALRRLNAETAREDAEATLTEKVENARRQAAEMIAEAQRKRLEFEKQMTEEEAAARRKREQAFKEKEKQGYIAGVKKGKEEAKKEYQRKISAANQLMDQARAAYKDYLKQAEPDILNLSIHIAEKIIGRSLTNDEDMWLSLVKKAVKEAKDQETIKITVSPYRFETLNRRRALLESAAQDAKIIIYADGDLSENDCMIETAFGRIEASVDAQLSVIKEKLIALLGGKRK